MKPLHFLSDIKPRGKFRAEIKRYLILLLIPILVLCLLYINVNQVVTQQAEEYAHLTANHFYVQSASMLHEMQLVSNAITQSKEIAWVLETDSANALNSLFICDTIRSCLTESPYVQHAYLLCSKTGNIYSEQGLYSSESLSTILRNVGADAEDLTSQSPNASFHILNENGMAPFCIFPILDDNDEQIGTLIVTLRMTEFLRIFFSLDAELCAVFNQDVFICSYIDGIPAEGFDWRDEASISALVGKRVTCEYLEQGDYTYLVAISRESYNRPLYVIIMWFFLYAAAALVLGYLYLYQVSKRRYQRISAMIDALPVSYTGDQSYEHVYDNIRKSLEDYRTQRENQQIENREHSLHMLLDGSADNPTVAQFRNAGVSPDYPVYYVAAFFAEEVPNPGEYKGGQHDALGFLHMLLRSTIHELAEQYQVPCAFCGVPKIGVAVLYGSDGEKLREIAQKLSGNVVEILTSSYGARVCATISNPAASVLRLPDAYQEAKRLHSFAQSINSTAAVISQEELQRSSGVLLNGDFIRQEQILINTILVRKYDAVPSMVESILSAHVSALRKNYALAQSRIQAISNVLVEGVRMTAFDSSEEDAKAIGQAASVRQLIAVTKQVYGRMAGQCRETSSEADIVSTACHYIAQNLSDPNLNVAAICEAAGVSVQKLTRMFQAQLHMAIAEYMNACRIKKAKELLTDKQLTIAQISQQVGYSNSDTFTRNFKKVEGITASEFRKMLSESEK